MADAALPASRTSAPADAGESPAARALRRLFRRKGAVAGLVVLALFIVAAVLAPLIAPYDPNAQTWTAVRRAPSAAHWFGTDDVGRDLLTRVIYGARASLMAGLVSVGIALAIGVPLGMIAGYLGGFVDALLGRITDAMLACPFLILAIALAAFLGPSLRNAMIAIGITTTPILLRLTRGQVMAVKVEDYVEAAGASPSSTSCRTSCPRCWCRRPCRSQPRSSPRRRCRSSASASSRRRRRGAACSIRRSDSSSTRPGWRCGPGSRSS